MRLPALIHVARTALELMGDRELIVGGSSSLRASFPDLGEDDGPLITSYDADFTPDPFNEDVGIWYTKR